MFIKRRHLVACAFAVLTALVLGFLAVNRYFHQLRFDTREQLERSLLDTASLNVEQFQSAIDFHIQFLESLSSQMTNQTDPASLIDLFDPLLDMHFAKQIGYAAPNGDAYLSGGLRANVAGQDFFQQSIHGSPFLSEAIRAPQGEEVYVHSLPVYAGEKTEITGVMFVVYDVPAFTNALQVDTYDGRVNSWLLRSDGYVVSVFHSNHLKPGMNMFQDFMRTNPTVNASAIETLRRCIAEGDSTIATISDGEKSYFINLTEIANVPGGDRWFLATTIATSILGKRIQPLLNGANTLILTIVILMLACAVIFIMTYLKQRRELFRLAYTCPLTRIDNYLSFKEKMRAGVEPNGSGFVVSTDLRSFSTINNAFGAAKGDELLYALAKILKSHEGSGELAAHVSCDSFVLFLHAADRDDLIRRIRLIRSDILDLSPLLDLPQLVPQFGICAVESTDSPEQAYGNATLAMQSLRERVDFFYSFFDDNIRNQTLEAQLLEGEFEQALAGRQFEMWYQPKFSPSTGEVVAAEALVRWRRPDGTLVSPGKFIPLFERNGMIAHLDEYTFDAVCAQQRTWMNHGLAVVPVSVNVSRVSLYFPNITGRYMIVMNRHGISTDHVELEITEGAIENNMEVENIINIFHSCGFHILVDDFGSGYSSLATLTKKCFDNIKIDKSLVDCIGTPEGESLLESIMQLSHKFNMTVTAEGVEHTQQRDFLIIHACDNVQGYYYSEPLPAAEFSVLLNKRAS